MPLVPSGLVGTSTPPVRRLAEVPASKGARAKARLTSARSAREIGTPVIVSSSTKRSLWAGLAPNAGRLTSTTPSPLSSKPRRSQPSSRPSPSMSPVVEPTEISKKIRARSTRSPPPTTDRSPVSVSPRHVLLRAFTVRSRTCLLGAGLMSTGSSLPARKSSSSTSSIETGTCVSLEATLALKFQKGSIVHEPTMPTPKPGEPLTMAEVLDTLPIVTLA